VSFFQPAPTTAACINTMNYAGVDVDNNWFICNEGIYAWGNGMRFRGDTCDNLGGQCIVVVGNGAEVNNTTHSVIIEGLDCYAQSYSCVKIDGATDVQLNHNFFNYAKQYSTYLTNQTSYRVSWNGNSFLTSTSSSYYNGSQSHIYMNTGCVDCQITGNRFMLSRNHDIDLESPSITNLLVGFNQFYGGQDTALNVGLAGSGIRVVSNEFDSPGNYAGDFTTPALVGGNYCHAPFSVTGVPSNKYDKGCFRFVGSGANGSNLRDNWTDSTTVAVAAIRGGLTIFDSSFNRSGWATGDVEFDASSATYHSHDERKDSYTGAITAIFAPMAVAGGLTTDGPVKIADQGNCTMSAGTCSAQNLSTTYGTAPNCTCTWNGSGSLTGFLKCPSTTTTVTPASSVGGDTAQVNWICLGN
jgi:hypothetical protein